jgi:hypothetical protein
MRIFIILKRLYLFNLEKPGPPRDAGSSMGHACPALRELKTTAMPSWNVGMMACWSKGKNQIFQPNTPLLHHSMLFPPELG